MITGPPKQMQVTATDTGSGIASINVVMLTNGAVTWSPSPIPPGTASVVVTATKLDQSQPTSWAFDVTDVAGNVKRCT